MNNKKVIYLMAQPEGTEEHSNIVILTKENCGMIPMNFIIEAGGQFCDSHLHFKNGINRVLLEKVLRETREHYGYSIYFALNKNGKIWEVEPTGGFQHINSEGGIISSL